MHFELPDLDKLLASFEGDEPIGTPLPDDDFSSPLVQYRGLCRSAVRLESSDDEDSREKSGEAWASAADKGIEIISKHWKNTDVAALLIQALTRTNGVAGLRFGYQLVVGLFQRYWEDLSRPWAGDFDQGLRTLSDLNSTVLAPLRRQQIAASASDTVLYHQYLFAQKLDNLSEEDRASHLARGAVTMSVLQQCVAETDIADFVQLLAELDGAREAIDATIDILSGKLGEQDKLQSLPATSNITELLEDIERAVRGLGGDRLAAESQSTTEGEADQGDQDGAVAKPGSAPGKPANRDDALLQLEQLAGYLESLEHQSLVPVVVRYGIWLARLQPQQFFQYFNEHGDQLFQILDPILGNSADSEDGI